jgi:putative mRNA 3-end processing factor
MSGPRPESWVCVRPEGLWVAPADAYVDPVRPVERAIVSHGHSDHARPNNKAVLATAETIGIMQARLGPLAGGSFQPLAYGEVQRVGEVDVTLVPAGHVLGSAQVVLEHRGSRVVVSGDYKRQPDPTCAPFEPVPCDVFVTEATFGLPVFRHPPAEGEIARLLHSVALFPERSHLVGAYTLGKAQRLIALLREAGWDRPIHLHGAMVALCELYEALGVKLGPLALVSETAKADLAGAIVLAPPSAIADRWSRRLPEPVVCAASGWMRVRQRARQQGVELPLIVSDHADWDALCRTIAEVDPAEVWVTHGREEALVHQIVKGGRAARALRLVGFEEDTPE